MLKDCQKIKSLQTQFLETVSEILDPKSTEGDVLLSYLERTSRQLNIRDFDVCEVISEAATRGLVMIEKKQERIQNPLAWLRKVCSNILYDMVKDEIKNRKLKVKNSSDFEIPNSFSKIESEEAHEALEKAFLQLSENEQEILNLRFYEGRKYREIQEYYVGKTGMKVKEATLRQRESRALKRLRVKFQEEYEAKKTT